MDLAVIGLAFAAIFVVELPDKTFIAALVLSTRYRPLLVWLGVAVAFLLQTLVAVTAGSLITLLPELAIQLVAAVIFLIGAVVLFRSASRAQEAVAEGEAEYAAAAREPKSGLAAVTTSFVVLFAAEWGDLSQLLTISLVAKYDNPWSVFVGAWGALLAVSGLAVLVGRALLKRLPLARIYYVGGSICLVLEAALIYELISK